MDKKIPEYERKLTHALRLRSAAGTFDDTAAGRAEAAWVHAALEFERHPVIGTEVAEAATWDALQQHLPDLRTIRHLRSQGRLVQNGRVI